MAIKRDASIEAVLGEWRTRVLNGFLTTAAIVAIPALAKPLERKHCEPETVLLPAGPPKRHAISIDAPQITGDAAKKHIRVIDDDPDAVYLLQENLNQQEFAITGTRSGQEGLFLARQQQPHVILLEILMPDADGWLILHALTEDPQTAHIPIILLTIMDKKALGFRLGASGYLLKPLDPAAVRDTLNRVTGAAFRKPKRVLVVDDDPSIADMLREFLPEADFVVEAVLDGVAGLEMIEANRPDILLLDLIMPRLDGFGVIESLRANPHTCDLPVIVISAKDLTQAESARLKE